MRVRLTSWLVLSVIVALSALVVVVAPAVRAEDLGYGEGFADALIAAENEEINAGQPQAGAVKVQTIAGSPETQEGSTSGDQRPVVSQHAAPDLQPE